MLAANPRPSFKTLRIPIYNISLKIYKKKPFNYALLVAIKYNICHTFLKNQSIGGWYGV